MSNGFLTRLSAILLIIVLILGISFVTSMRKAHNKIDEQVNLIAALGDTLRTIRLENGNQKASISSLTTSNTDAFLKIKSQDSAIIILQRLTSIYEKQLKEGGSIVTIKGETVFKDTGSTKYVYYNTGDSCRPTYHTTKFNKWWIADMRMNKDTATLAMQIYNSYDVIIGKNKKDGWFADVINHNPYSVTKEMRAYNVEIPKQKPKRVALAVFGGYGIPLRTGGQLSPMIGAGISYNFLYLF